MGAARVTVRRRAIIAEIPVRGQFVLDGGLSVRNRFTRNTGYVIDGLLRRASVTVYDEGGTGRTAATSSGSLLYSSASDTSMGHTLFAQWGTGTAAPTVTDNNLAAPSAVMPTSYIDLVETDTGTGLLVASRYGPSSLVSATEIGLKWLFNASAIYAALLARAVLPSAVSRSAYAVYLDGYRLDFPAEFTRWFVRALYCAAAGHHARQTACMPAKMADGSDYAVRNADAFAGSPDVAIGSDNTPPSPDDYGLKAPIGSLASQSQTVEVDTALQEVRVVRTGTFTPSANTALGEIGLFANINGYVGTTVAARRTLLARVALPEPVTLTAGRTYTIGIVLRFA
jgi:hypothetical protein